MEKDHKKMLWIFIAVAYGMVALMSIFMYIGYSKQYDLSALVNTHMMYPACGVILGRILTRKEGTKLPMGVYVTTLLTTAAMLAISIAAVFIHIEPLDMAGTKTDVWTLILSAPLAIGSMIVLILSFAGKKEINESAGIAHKNIKKSALLIVLFVVLLIIRVVVALALGDAMNGTSGSIAAVLKSCTSLNSVATLIMLPFSFFMAHLTFFGEEYGWRYYLQPLMEKKFGYRLGILFFGIIWGIWHIDIDFMYYTKESGPAMLVSQIITCISISIFFSYVMIKTQNLWAVVIMHFLNNNIAGVLMGGLEGMQNQSSSWKDIPPEIIASICFIAFILLPVFNSKKNDKEISPKAAEA